MRRLVVVQCAVRSAICNAQCRAARTHRRLAEAKLNALANAFN